MASCWESDTKKTCKKNDICSYYIAGRIWIWICILQVKRFFFEKYRFCCELKFFIYKPNKQSWSKVGWPWPHLYRLHYTVPLCAAKLCFNYIGILQNNIFGEVFFFSSNAFWFKTMFRCLFFLSILKIRSKTSSFCWSIYRQKSNIK